MTCSSSPASGMDCSESSDGAVISGSASGRACNQSLRPAFENFVRERFSGELSSVMAVFRNFSQLCLPLGNKTMRSLVCEQSLFERSPEAKNHEAHFHEHAAQALGSILQSQRV